MSLFRSFRLVVWFFAFPVWLSAQKGVIQSPDQFLPHALGTRFTPHHLIVDYFQYVDDQSPKVQVVQYGSTYEHRPLIAAIISTPENLANIDAIRLNHLRQAGLESGTPGEEGIVIVWLSYSVHGNEPAGAESAMAVLYDLVQGYPLADEWLKHTIVVLDPVLNPDGFDRYAQWSNSVSMKVNDPVVDAREHDEPWPGGRYNHYYFDLNRDWAWLTQKESRDRISFYHRWMPHVHADIHEMSSKAPYYFAPAAEPYHPIVTGWQREFQTLVGRNHSGHFDREGWRYFTKERYDLFYPSYGDTYPTFSGAIGMTYEQGGGGSANRAMILDYGDTLTLSDRIAHHRMASLSTVEVSARHAQKLITEFKAYFQQDARNPGKEFKSYIISKTNQPGRLADFLTLLDKHGIRYGYATEDHKSLEGFNYQTGVESSFDVSSGDVVIPVIQPKAVLAHVLMEPEGHLADSLTYDITAWSIPMAYGLKAYSTRTTLQTDTARQRADVVVSQGAKPYAYALEWGSLPAASTLAMLLDKGIVARYAVFPFVMDGRSWNAGTVLIMRGDNRKLDRFDEVVAGVAALKATPLVPVRSGMVDSGKDFGSYDYRIIDRPGIFTLAGPDVRSSSLGEIWHFFEEQLHYPLHIVNVDQLPDISLDQYTTLILPEGYYSISGKLKDRIQEWVQKGGRIIALGSANQKLTSLAGVSLGVRKEEEKDTTGMEDAAHQPAKYDADDRASVSEDIPGAIFQTVVDKAHPLSFGLGDQYWTLRTGTYQFEWLAGQGNAIFLDDTPHYFGFAGYKALPSTKKTLVAGQEEIGYGTVVYLPDDPLYRSFWYAGKLLFANALFF